MNKNRLMPELRFPDFLMESEWENPSLEDISDRIEEKVGDRKFITVSISAGTGFVSQVEKFSRDISGEQYKNYIRLQKGEFAYNKGNSKTFPQGCIYELREFDEVAAPNAFISFKFREKYIGNFYKGYFDSNYHGLQLQKFITSGARLNGLLNISPSNFFSIKLPTPKNIKEQQKIADCLSSLDDIITAQTQKLDLLKNHKKGLMQNLFPEEGETVPKRRFKEFVTDGDWLESKLGDKEISTFVNKKIPFEKLTLKNYISTENILPDFAGVGQISKLPSGNNFTEFLEGDILISNIRPYLRKVWKSSRQGGASNDVIVFRSGKKLHKDFLEFILKNDKFINYVMSGAKGVKMPRGDKGAMQEYPVSVPNSKNEQKKIADCLSSIDDQIQAQTQKIEHLKLHKKGLLQKLFPSTN